MSEMYRSFEQDFIKYLNSVHRRTALINTLTAGHLHTDQKDLAISEGLVEVVEADKCVSATQLRQMEIETFMLPVEKRSLMQAEVRKYREDLDSQKKLLKREEGLINTLKTKETLMGSSSSVSSKQAFASRSQLRGTEMLLDQNARLEEGRRSALEAEGLAIGSMHALKGQRDQIHKMTSNVTPEPGPPNQRQPWRLQQAPDDNAKASHHEQADDGRDRWVVAARHRPSDLLQNVGYSL